MLSRTHKSAFCAKLETSNSHLKLPLSRLSGRFKIVTWDALQIPESPGRELLARELPYLSFREWKRKQVYPVEP